MVGFAQGFERSRSSIEGGPQAEGFEKLDEARALAVLRRGEEAGRAHCARGALTLGPRAAAPDVAAGW